MEVDSLTGGRSVVREAKRNKQGRQKQFFEQIKKGHIITLAKNHNAPNSSFSQQSLDFLALSQPSLDQDLPKRTHAISGEKRKDFERFKEALAAKKSKLAIPKEEPKTSNDSKRGKPFHAEHPFANVSLFSEPIPEQSSSISVLC